MKKITQFILLSVAVVIFAGCSLSAPSTTTTTQSGTVKKVYSEAETFVKQTYPQAVFVGYNNHDATIDRYDILPATLSTTGQSDTWFYFFAKNSEVVSDKVIANEDAVAIKFEKGTLTLWEAVMMRDFDLNEGAVTGADMLKEDTDAILVKVLAAVNQTAGTVQTPYHIDWRMLPTIAEITVYTSANAGFDAKYNYKTGEVSFVRALTFN